MSKNVFEALFRINAEDDTKAAFESAGRNAKDYAERFKALRESMILSPKDMSEFERMFKKSYKSQQDESKKVGAINRQTSDDAEDYAKAALLSRHEDIALAEKLKQIAKRGQGEEFKGATNFEKKMGQASKNTKAINKDVIEIGKNLKKVNMIPFDMKRNLALPAPTSTAMVPSGHGAGALITQDGKGNIIPSGSTIPGRRPAEITGELVKGEQPKSISSTLTGMAGFLKGGAAKFLGPIAAAAGGYSILAQFGSQMKQTMTTQLQTLKTLGQTQALGMPTGQFVKGIGTITNTGFSRENMMRYGITPTSYSQALGAAGSQTDKFGLLGGPSGQAKDIAFNASKISSAYGIDSGQAGLLGGVAGRFKTPGGMYGDKFLNAAVGAGEKSGMGGARMSEFFDNLQGAITKAVYSGSKQSNESILGTMTALTAGADERLKVMVPQMMEATSNVMLGASTLQGGPGESFAFQAVRQNMGPNASLRDVRSQLSKGGTMGNMKAMVNFAQQFGQGMGQDYIEYMLQQSGMFGGLKDPNDISKMVNVINTTKATDDKGLMDEFAAQGIKFTDKRLGRMEDVFMQTTSQDVLDELKGLNNAAKTMNESSMGFKMILNNILNAMSGGQKPYVPPQDKSHGRK